MFKKSVLVALVLLGYSSTAFAFKTGAGKVEDYWTVHTGGVYFRIEGANYMCRLDDNPEIAKRQLAVVQLAIATNKAVRMWCFDEVNSPNSYPYHGLHRIDIVLP